MESPTSQHLKAAKRVLRYIHGTLSFCLRYTKSQKFQLTGYSGSDYAGDKVDKKSTSGQLVIVAVHLPALGD